MYCCEFLDPDIKRAQRVVDLASKFHRSEFDGTSMGCSGGKEAVEVLLWIGLKSD